VPAVQQASLEHPTTSRAVHSESSDDSEARLARRARTDRSAFSELYEAHAARVYHYLLARTSSPAEAEELTSRVFLNALTRLDQYSGRGSFQAWLMTIARNLLFNWYRDRGRRPPTEDLTAAATVAADVPGPEAGLERNERIARVREAVGDLSADRQQLISLKYVDGLPNAEIGRIMGRSEGAVKALHHRTLRELQQRLGDPETVAP
jgi:RNA polymerase sigma-70 factor (ECF subfamily)